MKTNPTLKPLFAGLAIAGASITSSFAGGFDTSAFVAADVNVSGGLDSTEFNTTLDVGLSVRAQRRSFRRADYNRDGAIQVNEFLIFRGVIDPANGLERAFWQSDLSLNSELSWEEFTTTFSGKVSLVNIRRGFLRADANVNDSVTLAEYLSFRRGQSPPSSLTIYQLADFDGNSQVTLTEFGYSFGQNVADAKILAKFGRLDDNTDGFLVTSEWNPGVRP